MVMKQSFIDLLLLSKKTKQKTTITTAQYVLGAHLTPVHIASKLFASDTLIFKVVVAINV
jgi:hypothetical protein